MVGVPIKTITMLTIVTMTLFCPDCDANVECKKEIRTDAETNLETIEMYCPQGHQVQYKVQDPVV